MMKQVLLFLCFLVFSLQLIAQDSIPPKKYLQRYEAHNDKLIAGVSFFFNSQTISLWRLDDMNNIYDAYCTENRREYYDHGKAGVSVFLQYAKFKFSFAKASDINRSEEAANRSSFSSYGFSYGNTFFDVSFNYNKFYKQKNFEDASTSLLYEEPELTIKIKPFKTGYVSQFTAANYIQKKSAFTIYALFNPYHRKYYTEQNMTRREITTTFGACTDYWEDLLTTKNLTQTGIQAMLGAEVNIVILKSMYLSGLFRFGANFYSSTQTYFDGSEIKKSGYKPMSSIGFGGGFNFNSGLFLKFSREFTEFSTYFNRIYISSSSDYIHLTVGYRFKEPEFLKKAKSKTFNKNKP